MGKVNDVPAAAPLAADRCKAPEGYVPCTMKCGRWTNDGKCWTCCAILDGLSPVLDGGASHSKTPDWTPPLAAQPAETKSWCASCGCGAGPCDYEHLPTCPNAKPAPAKVVDTRPKCGNNDCETPFQNVAQRWCSFSDGTTPATLEWSCEPCHLRDEAEFAELMMFESTGTPYTGPERLERPKLAHSFGIEDPALEDC